MKLFAPFLAALLLLALTSAVSAYLTRRARHNSVRRPRAPSAPSTERPVVVPCEDESARQAVLRDIRTGFHFVCPHGESLRFKHRLDD